MNLLKYLQSQGIGSRKQCQWLIENGCVALNGETLCTPKTEILPADIRTLHIDGEAFTVIPQPFFYIILNKPAGFETSHKPRDYPSVFSLFPDHMRNIDMQAVGRLDADTTGILLITNDGQFNHRMTSPKHHAEKVYRATLKHPADGTFCQRLLNGVLLHDENQTVAAQAAELTDPHTLILTISEGKYHQVKRMAAAAGNRIEALHRTWFNGWTADDLAAGSWRFFDPCNN